MYTSKNAVKGGRKMKRVMVMLLAFVMVMTFAACGAEEEKPQEVTEAKEAEVIETTRAEEPEIFKIIEAKNCFYDAGFVELIAGAEAAAEYTFTGENSEATQWSIYVLDEAFDDGLRYIRQIAEPVLEGDGTITVNAGQYVYVYCSSNEFTTGIVDENAKLMITVK